MRRRLVLPERLRGSEPKLAMQQGGTGSDRRSGPAGGLRRGEGTIEPPVRLGGRSRRLAQAVPDPVSGIALVGSASRVVHRSPFRCRRRRSPRPPRCVPGLLLNTGASTRRPLRPIGRATTRIGPGVARLEFHAVRRGGGDLPTSLGGRCGGQRRVARFIQQPRCQCRRRSGSSAGIATRWPRPGGMSRLQPGQR